MKEENAIALLSEKYDEYPVIRALLQLIPLWSAPDTLLTHRARILREKRLMHFFNELAQGKVSLTEDMVSSDAFLHCFFATLSSAMRAYRKDKICMYARLLVSFPESGEEAQIVDLHEEKLRLLDEIPPTAILLLKLSLNNSIGAKPEYDWYKGPYVNDDYPDIPEYLIWHAYDFLRVNDLIKRATIIVATTGPRKVPWGALKLSRFGEMFVSEVMGRDLLFSE